MHAGEPQSLWTSLSSWWILLHPSFEVIPVLYYTFLAAAIPLLEVLSLWPLTSLSATIVTSFPSRGLSLLVTGNNWQGLDMESREVVKVQLCHSWSDTPVPNDNNKVKPCHGGSQFQDSQKMGVLYGTLFQTRSEEYLCAVDVMFFWNKLMMNGAPGCPLPASPSPFEQSAQYVLLRGWWGYLPVHT